jgi:hypothetical protein
VINKLHFFIKKKKKNLFSAIFFQIFGIKILDLDPNPLKMLNPDTDSVKPDPDSVNPDLQHLYYERSNI